MSFEPDYIVTTFILAFGLACLGSGLFTAYFGAGKSRTIGIGLTVLGLIFVFCYYYLPWMADPPTYEPALVKDALLAGVGAMIGAGIAMGLILVVLMKVDTTEDLEDLDLDDLEDLDLDEELKKLEAELAAEEATEETAEGDTDSAPETGTEDALGEETSDEPPSDEPPSDEEPSDDTASEETGPEELIEQTSAEEQVEEAEEMNEESTEEPPAETDQAKEATK